MMPVTTMVTMMTMMMTMITVPLLDIVMCVWQHEAAKVMQDAINDFQGSGEEVRLTIANVDLALARGAVDDALGMLRSLSLIHI